jgi:hypothetical protein
VSSNDFTPQRYADFLRDVITRFSDRPDDSRDATA